MNAPAISDQHTIEFEFECLDIEVEGLIFAEVSGIAELAVNDHGDGSFYVKHIILSGDRRQKVGPVTTLRRREASMQHLYRPVESDAFGPHREHRTFTTHLFRAIETALYAYQPAIDAWQGELEAA